MADPTPEDITRAKTAAATGVAPGGPPPQGVDPSFKAAPSTPYAGHPPLRPNLMAGTADPGPAPSSADKMLESLYNDSL